METNQDKINARVMISRGQGRRFIEQGWDRTDWISLIGGITVAVLLIATLAANAIWG